MEETFRIVPASSQGPFWILAFVTLVLVGVTALIGVEAYASRNARFTLSPEGLRLSGGAFGRLIPLADLEAAGARAVDLTREPRLAPARRTFGTGMPGYAAGWFRLAGGEKALLFVTDRRRVVYIPTTRGHAVLLSVREPERFVESLRRLAG